jgi:hypothetical protein
MKYSDNSTIIKEYRDAFRKHANHGIIDMDHYLKHSFSFQIHRLEEVIEAWNGVIPAYRQSQNTGTNFFDLVPQVSTIDFAF